MPQNVLRSHDLPGGSRVRLVRYAAGERHRAHAHDRSSLTLVLRGVVEERVGARTDRGTAFSVVVKPSGVEHADDFGSMGVEALRVELSAGDDSWAGCGSRSWQWIHAGSVSKGLIGVLRTLREPGGAWSRSRTPVPASDASLEDLLLETVAALPEAERAPRVPPRWLARVRESLSEECVPIRILAEREGVHPVALARLFRLRYGASPSSYRRLARARRAAALLTGTRTPIADVALEAGYSDQAHLTRELRSTLGITPRTARSLAIPS